MMLGFNSLRLWKSSLAWSVLLCSASLFFAPFLGTAMAQEHSGGGEASLVLPDVSQVQMVGLNGRSLMFIGLLVCLLGLVFGLVIFIQVKRLPVHQSMREVSELIYETCKT